MLKQRPVRIVLVVVALFAVWWLWSPSRFQEPLDEVGESPRLVSSIQPITRADAAGDSFVSVNHESTRKDIGSDRTERKVRQKIAKRFAHVNQMIEDDQSELAIAELNSITKEFPRVIEPYINLAALYSKSNRLELARQTLNKGIKANQNTELLFESRQTVLGVQAARAYQQALNEPEASTEVVLLPFISTIDLPTQLSSTESSNNLQSEVTRLNSELSSLQLERDQLRQANSTLEKDKSDLEQLNGELELEKSGFVQNKVSFDQYKANLEQDKSSLEQDKENLNEKNQALKQTNAALTRSNQKLEAQTQALAKSEGQLTEQAAVLEQDKSRLSQTVEELQTANKGLLSRIKELELARADIEQDERLIANQELASKAMSDKVSSLQAKLDASELARKESQQTLKSSQTELKELEQLKQQQQDELLALRKQISDGAALVANAEVKPVEPTQAVEVVKADTKPPVKLQTPEQQSQAVVDIVKSWAADWSAQNVSGYVSHYTENYTPPRGSLTHEQWLEQRQIRLTNKTFINVEVSDFKSQNRGDKFVVTFSQHYRSNTVDDRIVKRLVLAKDGNDWSQAKIVDEIVVSR